MPMNYGGFQLYSSPENFGGFSSPLGVQSAFTPPVFNPSVFTQPAFTQSAFVQPAMQNSLNYDSFFRITPPTKTSGASSSSSSTSNKSDTKISSITKDCKEISYDEMLKCVCNVEGGYNPNDCGQASNKGVRQSTYDEYRRSKNLPKNDVKNITDEEVKDLYYTMYYKKSGVDKIKNPRLALYVFDTAVNMGVSAAKDLLSKCGNNPDKFKQLRLERYENIAKNNPEKRQYLSGWKNRVAKVEKFADNYAVA